MERKDLGVEHLEKVIQKVLNDASYRDPARRIPSVLARAGGLDLAADLIEWVFKTNQMVTSAREQPNHLARQRLPGAFVYELI